MLQEFVAVNRDEIIRRCRAKVARRSMPPVTPAEIDHGVPVFLDQLAEGLAHTRIVHLHHPHHVGPARA